MRKKGCKQREVGGVLVLYPASGFQSDVEMLLQKFVESKSIRYEEFSSLWRENNFSLVHLGRNGIRERRDFLEEAFRIIVQYVLPPYSLQVRVGGLYLLNGMYRTQMVNPPLRIRIPLSCWKDFQKLRSEIIDQKHLDALYIFRQLVSERAFFICAFSTMLSVDEVYTENGPSSSAGQFGLSGWGEEPSLLSRLQDDDNIGQLNALHEKYHELKCELNASRGGSANDPGSSLNLIKPNIAESIFSAATDSKSQTEETEHESLSSPNKSANDRALKIQSLKQRAQETNFPSKSLRSRYQQSKAEQDNVPIRKRGRPRKIRGPNLTVRESEVPRAMVTNDKETVQRKKRSVSSDENPSEVEPNVATNSSNNSDDKDVSNSQKGKTSHSRSPEYQKIPPKRKRLVADSDRAVEKSPLESLCTFVAKVIPAKQKRKSSSIDEDAEDNLSDDNSPVHSDVILPTLEESSKMEVELDKFVAIRPNRRYLQRPIIGKVVAMRGDHSVEIIWYTGGYNNALMELRSGGKDGKEGKIERQVIRRNQVLMQGFELNKSSKLPAQVRKDLKAMYEVLDDNL